MTIGLGTRTNVTSGLESVGGVDVELYPPFRIAVAQTTAAAEDCILGFDGQYLVGGRAADRSSLARYEHALAAFSIQFHGWKLSKRGLTLDATG